MNQCTVNWEDEENNRIVQLAVDYQIDSQEIVIEDVTPQAILFVDSVGQPQRRLQVYTDAGRTLLRRIHDEKVGRDSLKAEVESRLLAPAQ